MILDIIVINLLEEIFIFVAIAFLMNRKHLLLQNTKRILIGVATVLFSTGMVVVFRKVPGVPFMQYRIPITLVLFFIIFMITLKLNWLQSLVGNFIIFIAISIVDGFSVIFYKLFNIPFSEETLTINLQTLPAIISARALLIVLLYAIIKFNITIKIPDRFVINKTVVKLIGCLSLLGYLVLGFIWEVTVKAQTIRVIYVLSIVVAGAVLGYVIVKYVHSEAMQIKELKKTRNKIKTGEIYDELINRRY